MCIWPLSYRSEKNHFVCLPDFEIFDNDCFMLSFEVTLFRENMKRTTYNERGKLHLLIQMVEVCTDVKDTTSG